MEHNTIELARKSRAVPREVEREVVAAVASAEGTANLSRGGRGHNLGFLLPLLALAAGAALGYGGTRRLGPSPWRRLPAEPWRRVADAMRPIFGSRA